MPEYETKQLCENTKAELTEVVSKLSGYLNYHAVPQLLGDEDPPDGDKRTYYEEYLADLRRLLVSCERGVEKLALVLRRPDFHLDFAERVLHDIVHTCISNFFYPQHEVYEEDGRNAYTGKDAIRFRRKDVDESLKKLTISLSKTFEFLREELHYYETDYVTQMRLQQKPIR